MALAFGASLGTVTNTATLTTSGAASAGSRVFVFVWWYDTTSTCTGATGGGLTWVVDRQYHSTFSGDNNQAILSADAPSGLASSTVITPTFSGDGPDFGPGIAAAYFTGVATGASGYVDVIATNKEDFEEVWSTNNLVTTNADDLLIAFSLAAAGGTSNTATAPASEIHDWFAEGSNRCATEYRIVSSTSTYTLAGTWSASLSSQHNIAIAYKAAAAAAAGGVGYQRIYGPAQLATSAADLYTVPTGARARLRHIFANNPTGSPVDFTFSIGTDAAATRLYDSYNIPAGESLEWAYDHALVAGEKIQAYAGTSSALVLTVDAYLEPT